MTEDKAASAESPAPTQTRARCLSGQRLVLLVSAIVIATVGTVVGGPWAVVAHCRAQVEAAVGEALAFSDLTAVGSGLAVGFEQRDSAFKLIRYYYVIPDGRVMVRLADSEFMIRYDGDEDAADGP